MQRFLLCVVGVVALAACGDDGSSDAAPDTVLDEVPAALTNDTHVRIVFHATTDANAFACQLDRCRSCRVRTAVRGGCHRRRAHVSRVGRAGTAIDATPAEHAWTVDAMTPDTTILSGPPALDNSLIPEITFEGSDPGGGPVTFECSLDGDPFAACTTPSSLIVIDGAHVYSVRAKDAAGNVDPTPAEHAWTIDATAPETIITAGPTTNLTTGRAVSFSFMSPNTTAATFECKLDNAAFAACTSPRALTNLAGGSHTFTVRARDASAVDPSPASRTWTVDAMPPDVDDHVDADQSVERHDTGVWLHVVRSRPRRSSARSIPSPLSPARRRGMHRRWPTAVTRFGSARPIHSATSRGRRRSRGSST